MATESCREVAVRVVKEQFPGDWQSWRNLTAAIEAELKARDERAVKIVDDRAKELRHMATATLLDHETAIRFKAQADVCDELSHTIRNEES